MTLHPHHILRRITFWDAYRDRVNIFDVGRDAVDDVRNPFMTLEISVVDVRNAIDDVHNDVDDVNDIVDDVHDIVDNVDDAADDVHNVVDDVHVVVENLDDSVENVNDVLPKLLAPPAACAMNRTPEKQNVAVSVLELEST